MLLALTIASALATPPHGDAHFASGVGADGSGGALVGGSLGLRVHPRVRASLRADGGLLPFYGPGAMVRPEIRFTPTDPYATWGRLDLVAGFGVRAADIIGEIGFGGAALEVPLGAKAWDLRIEGGYLFDRAGLGSVVLSVGPVFDVRRKPPEELYESPVMHTEVVVAPPALPATPDVAEIVTELGGVEVWFPHPICRWMPLAEANDLLATMGEADVQVVAPGHRSGWMNVKGPMALSLAPLSEVGSLVIVTTAGDQVRLDGRSVSANEDGVLLLTTEPGQVSVEIVGNGRRQDLNLVVAPEMTTWARARSPETLHVTFPADSAVLSPRGLRQIREIAEAIGDARFTVEGSFSPEGDLEQNMRLAADRARAGKKALVEAGVDESRIDLITKPKQIDSTDWRVLRAAVITPSGMTP